MSKTILSKELRHPVGPENIDSSKRFWEAFGHIETEISARWLVQFARYRQEVTAECGEHWDPFTYEEIEAYYHKHLGREERFLFNRLIREGFIVEVDSRYYFTAEFVGRCVTAQPVLTEVAHADKS